MITKMKLGWMMVLAMVGVTGCATQNQFADNATEYNRQAEQTQDRALLLNVLRASRRRPLSFLDLTTLAGSTPASGSLGFSIPLTQPSMGTTATTVSPTAALSGGPTVNMTSLNTQEFYKGILAPIPLSTIDILFQRGINRELLFNLLFSRIQVTTYLAGAPIRPLILPAENYPGVGSTVGTYQQIVEYLVDHKATTASHSGPPTIFGPPLLPADVIGQDMVSEAAAAGLNVATVGWCGVGEADRLMLVTRVSPKIDTQTAAKLESDCTRLSKVDSNAPDAKEVIEKINKTVAQDLSKIGISPNLYRLQKDNAVPVVGFCSDLPIGNDGDGSSLCGGGGSTKSIAASGALLSVTRLPDLEENAKGGLSPDDFCLLLQRLPDGNKLVCATGWDKNIKIEFIPRSVYGLIYYLGELVRRENYPDRAPGTSRRELTIRKAFMNGPRPTASCAETASSKAGEPICESIFLVRKAPGKEQGFLSVTYDNINYFVPDPTDPSQTPESGKTYEVMDIVTELLSLNRSAKDLPATSVFTLRGVP